MYVNCGEYATFYFFKVLIMIVTDFWPCFEVGLGGQKSVTIAIKTLTNYNVAYSPQFTYIKKNIMEQTHMLVLRGIASSSVSGSPVLKMMAQDNSSMACCWLGLNHLSFHQVCNVSFPFWVICVHSVLKGTFLHVSMTDKKVCVPSVFSFPPHPPLS